MSTFPATVAAACESTVDLRRGRDVVGVPCPRVVPDNYEMVGGVSHHDHRRLQRYLIKLQNVESKTMRADILSRALCALRMLGLMVSSKAIPIIPPTVGNCCQRQRLFEIASVREM